MPRPCKRRRVCRMPSCRQFGPIEPSGEHALSLTMTVEEYETIRLIDAEGLTQEQCAARMEVARTTAQAIYNSARFKLAQCLVHGMELTISGGDYQLCEEAQEGCACPHHQTGRCHILSKEEWKMKIAVTYDNGEIFQHFGHTEYFKIYEAADGKVLSSEVCDTNGSGHGALAGFLMEKGVDTLICGGIGGGARQALAQCGIQLYGGVSGNADEAVAALLAGSLSFNPDVKCDHHDHAHHEGGSCGEHHCGGGEHHCGN